MHHTRSSLIAAGTAAVAICTAALAVNTVGGQASAGGAIHASAEIVNPSGQRIGWAKFTEDAAGRVHVNVKVSGLTPGLHGTHIHNVGDCTQPGFGTFGHFNPTAQVHGSHTKHETSGHHAGDLPNLHVTESAAGSLNVTSAHFTLAAEATTSLFDIDGSSIMIHAGTDDYATQPTGASGARVACGVIARD